MATLGLIVLATSCFAVHAFPESPRPYRNTIFLDEKLEGEVFEDVDSFKDITLYNTVINPFRLPTTTRPQHYNVEWIIDMEKLWFSGSVDIELYATQPNVNEIVIHAHDLNITSLSLRQGTTPMYQEYFLQPQYHFLYVALTNGSLDYNAINPIIYTLSIEFNAPLRTDMYGIYRSWFRNTPTEEPRWMASTQFQATAARFAFPCYDEPSFKATFDINIAHPQNYTSWSCTRLRTSTPYVVDNETIYSLDQYYRTPVMSTYLLALIVAEYDTKELFGPHPQTNEEVLKYEVIGRSGAMERGQGNFSFDIGQELLSEMSSHINLDFFSVHQYLKMTQAAIPDFGAGAMENWGLLTYREAYLMYDENHTNSYFKQLIAYILSHEIAHMWFGNLVTCDWWDALWLNEGFARYYQYYLTHWVAPEMGLATRFITEQIHTSLLSDSADFPHPLTNPGVGSPASVSAMFSTLSYNKGAAVIRMTEHLMGFQNHLHGLRRYISTRQFQTARPIDLFEDLQVSAVETGAIADYGPDFNIVDYYKTWTEQGGHPVLNVAVDHQTGNMTITQRRFNINTGYSTANSHWIIPVTFATASNPDFENTKPTHIIRDSLTLINRGTIGDEWVIFNKQQTGYYRVNYDDYTWDLIVMQLRGPNRTDIHEYNRAQIVNDVFQFARSGLMTYTRAFNILSFLEHEDAYAPWVAAITGFNWINNRVIGTPLEEPLNALFRSWAVNIMDSLTYEPIPGESFMRSYLRYQLAPVMCRIGHPQCLSAASSQFSALRNAPFTEVAVDSRNWVYCNGLRQGLFSDYEFLKNRFLNHYVYTEKIQILMVLGCTEDATALRQFMDYIVDDNFVIRRQDYNTAFNSAVTGNENNTDIIFQYIGENLDRVANAFGSVVIPLSSVAARLRTPADVTRFRNWAVENRGALGMNFQQVFNAAETSLSALQWAQENTADFNNYFQTGNVPLVTSTPAPIVTTTPVTATVAAISAPTTPDLPDSANTSFISILTIISALLIKYIF
uniref:Aminopeptidase N3 n=1 Tax=Diatraea saccharalis TaxID=40085 RepID=E0A211_9NEOP|nr:aminopeptidase N3 [Diatraea saccharalis]